MYKAEIINEKEIVIFTSILVVLVTVCFYESLKYYDILTKYNYCIFRYGFLKLFTNCCNLLLTYELLTLPTTKISNSWYIKDVLIWATKFDDGLSGLEYIEKLKKLNLPILTYRRLAEEWNKWLQPNSFYNPSAKIWNRLPNEVVNAPSTLWRDRCTKVWISCEVKNIMLYSFSYRFYK